VAAQTEVERREALAGAAKRSLAAISDVVLQAIANDAPTAQIRRDPDVPNWSLRLGKAHLTMARIGTPDPWEYSSPPFDLVLVSELGLQIPADTVGYEGRSHSLWFADAQAANQYQWFETAFTLSALVGQIPRQAPFALDGGPDAALALSPATHTHQVAWPFTPLVVDDLGAFIDRWAGWLADAAEGRLQRPAGPEGEVRGSWRLG
jgi:serine/threonine-protein kinase